MSDKREKIPEKVLQLLIKYLPSDETKAAVHYFLATDANSDRIIQVLESFVNYEEAFKKVTENLVKDLEHLENDESFHSIMHDLWNNYLMPKDSNTEIDNQLIISQISQMKERDMSTVTVALLETFISMSPAVQQQFIDSLKRVPFLNNSLAPTSSALVNARINCGKIVSVGIVAVQLGWEAFQSIRKWMDGEISGERCVKCIIDSAATTAAGVGGGIGGAAIGSMILPGVGTVIGAFAGSVISANVAASLTDWLTCKLFDLPKEVAVENAFRFLGLSADASNHEINSAYRRLALEYHPDKGGDRDDWNKLQCSLAVIKISKGE